MPFQVDRLFRVCTTVELPGQTVQVRSLGDLEMRSRESLAMSRSAKYEKELQDPASDAYQGVIAPLLDQSDDSLRAILAEYYRQLDAEPKAQKDIQLQFIPEPDDASMEEKRDTVRQQEEHETEVKKQRAELVEKLVASYKEDVAKWDHARLVEMVKSQAIRVFSYGEYIQALIYASLYYATELDGKRYFPNLESIQNVGGVVLARLRAAFVSVNEQDIWELTKASLKGE